ncbi:hypothetical protein HK097_005347 [Rhizophlyctis rosea]|uniref:Uncharacterized protein n=1 Tax=Rhizophlyctis rosea TaxID=64517 RepID=A0AAD5SKZ8_9FUNG|nr:hypothetical protein HK097_005347 [Rhizophlyctis rosea]
MAVSIRITLEQAEKEEDNASQSKWLERARESLYTYIYLITFAAYLEQVDLCEEGDSDGTWDFVMVDSLQSDREGKVGMRSAVHAMRVWEEEGEENGEGFDVLEVGKEVVSVKAGANVPKAGNLSSSRRDHFPKHFFMTNLFLCDLDHTTPSGVTDTPQSATFSSSRPQEDVPPALPNAQASLPLAASSLPPGLQLATPIAAVSTGIQIQHNEDGRHKEDGQPDEGQKPEGEEHPTTPTDQRQEDGEREVTASPSGVPQQYPVELTQISALTRQVLAEGPKQSTPKLDGITHLFESDRLQVYAIVTRVESSTGHQIVSTYTLKTTTG